MRDLIATYVVENTEKFKTKADLWSEMNQIQKAAVKDEFITKAEQKLAWPLMQYQHYKGLGMFPENIEKNQTIIDIENKEEMFKDRTAPAFRNVRDFIINCGKANKMDLAQEYIDALAIYGIHITVDPEVANNTTKNYETLNELVDRMDILQGQICGLADEIRDNAKATAAEINLLNIANPVDQTETPCKISAGRVRYSLDKVLKSERTRTKQYIAEKNDIFIHRDLIDFIGFKTENDIAEEFDLEIPIVEVN